MKANHLFLCVLSGLFLTVHNTFSLERTDQVFLKDGNIVCGTIIEQIPGQSIKIQTKDGNIWVYQMSDIQKMDAVVSQPKIELKKGGLFGSENKYFFDGKKLSGFYDFENIFAKSNNNNAVNKIKTAKTLRILSYVFFIPGVVAMSLGSLDTNYVLQLEGCCLVIPGYVLTESAANMKLNAVRDYNAHVSVNVTSF